MAPHVRRVAASLALLAACAPDDGGSLDAVGDGAPSDAVRDVAAPRDVAAARDVAREASAPAPEQDASSAPAADASTALASDAATPARDATLDLAVDAARDATLDLAVDAPRDAAPDASPDVPLSPRPVLVRAGDTWRYLDTGQHPGSAWAQRGFDDGAWRAGRAQFGYGDGDEATVVRSGPTGGARYITTWFRRVFNVADASSLRQVTLRLLRDDGAVVYLNGLELTRSNLPTGPIAATTRALSTVSDADESRWIEEPVDPTRLVTGANVVAAEVHQVSPDSSDLSFDLELLGVRGATYPVTDAPVLVGAGDIAWCGGPYDEATARLLDAMPGTVFTLGDTVYESGTDAEFANCYHPSWGRHRWRTRPSVGNHEYQTPDATGYYRYFGAAAGNPSRGWYSYELGAWHVVVLNSNCGDIGGCGRGSPQDAWLVADLAAHPARCTLAMWHHPRFSSGVHGSNSAYESFFQRLYDAGADVVLTGHDHDYERFAPQTPAGRADPARGVRQFVVGTGGVSLRSFPSNAPNSEARDVESHGVLRLVLRPTSYEWRFVPVPGDTFTDSGATPCH